MFKYVNELSNEIEDLDKQLMDLKEEKERFNGQDNQIDQMRRTALLDY